MKIKVRYYNLTLDITKKVEEEIDIPENSTVNDAIKIVCQKYGYAFEQRVTLTMDSMEGKVQRANVYLNNRPVDYEYEYPEKLNTKLKEGDILSFGSLIGGGN
ncbi:MAG: hypothetical protein D6734_06790 [Candidatus Schekmanbacteria bacterium]|nr:MAG: hypothetical protein D6734_06790 [Candidatus Schekmanbacteria bacterium]